MNQYQPYGSANQPYGRVPGAAALGAPRRMHKAFGITYIALFLMMVLFIWIADALTRADSELKVGVAMIAGVLLLWGAYVVSAGIMAIKGKIAGPIMGLVDASLISLLVLLSTALGSGNEHALAGAMCWMLPNIAIIILALYAIKERSAAPPAHAAPRPAYGAPQPRFYGPQQPTGGMAPRPPLPRAAAAGSPKHALLAILVLAASLDPDAAIQQAALGRARIVALKLLGEGAQPRISMQLAATVEIADIESELRPHTTALTAAASAKLNENAVKAVAYILKGAHGVDPMGEEFLSTLKAQLGMQA